MQPTPKFSLSRRLTHRFNSSYSYLDESEDVGTARTLISKPWGKPDPWGESRRTLMLLVINTQATDEAVREAIGDTLQYSCQCQHDCCGHWQHSIDKARRLKSGAWVVIQSSYRNF